MVPSSQGVRDGTTRTDAVESARSYLLRFPPDADGEHQNANAVIASALLDSERELATAREAALEEAANVCDSRSPYWSRDLESDEINETACELACAIRALKSPAQGATSTAPQVSDDPVEPLMCESISTSDYCYHCGRSILDNGGPCKVRERPRLQAIPDSEIVAFGCRMESLGEIRCDKWCHETGCPYTLSAAFELERKP